MKNSAERPLWFRCLITACVGLAMALLLLILRGFFTASAAEERFRILSDALFVPGALILGIGLLIWISGEGEFDMLSFGVKKTFGLILSEEKRSAQPKTLFDYKQQRAAREPASFRHLLIVGLAMILLGGAATLFTLQGAADQPSQATPDLTSVTASGADVGLD